MSASLESFCLLSRPPGPLGVPAPRGGPLLRGQHAPRLGQDHPREAPPVGDAAAVDVVPQVVPLLRGEIDRALLGEPVEPGVVLGRQVVVGEVVEGGTPNRAAHRLPKDAAEAKRAVAERRANGALVLPGLLGTLFAGWSKAKAALDKAVMDARVGDAATAGTCATLTVPWSIHDLRRTAATGLQRLGIRLEVPRRF
jgi:hypothetical protein